MKGMRACTVATAALACLAAACSAAPRKSVAEDPRPNLDLQPTGKTLSLRLSPAVLDEYKATGPGIRPIRVGAWRQTLANGFRNAFGESFQVVGEGEPADLTIEVVEAALHTESAAVSGYYGVVAIRASLRYKVRLLGRSGEVLYRLVGDAPSKGTINSVFQFRQVVKDATETFWETVGDKFFLKPWPQVPVIPGLPAPTPAPGPATTPTTNTAI